MKRRSDEQENRLRHEAAERKKILLGDSDTSQETQFATDQDCDEM